MVIAIGKQGYVRLADQHKDLHNQWEDAAAFREVVCENNKEKRCKQPCGRSEKMRKRRQWRHVFVGISEAKGRNWVRLPEAGVSDLVLRCTI